MSEYLADLLLTARAFEVFVGSMYQMRSYNGEPMIEELVLRTKEVRTEIETFREIFEITIDEELEDGQNTSIDIFNIKSNYFQ